MIKVVQSKHSFLLLLLFSIPGITYSQRSDSTKVASYFGGTVMVTNKGISSIPNLTLGKPATIITMSVGRRVRFEPEFRFALEGKPWMFIFWWRYDLLNTDKFLFKLRANPTIVFNTITVTTNNVSNDIQRASRTLTGDLTTSYFLKMDENNGFYSNATLTFAKRNFPLSFSTLINKTIHTEIPIGKDFLWNVSLTYTFNKKYVEQ